MSKTWIIFASCALPSLVTPNHSFVDIRLVCELTGERGRKVRNIFLDSWERIFVCRFLGSFSSLTHFDHTMFEAHNNHVFPRSIGWLDQTPWAGHLWQMIGVSALVHWRWNQKRIWDTVYTWKSWKKAALECFWKKIPYCCASPPLKLHQKRCCRVGEVVENRGAVHLMLFLHRSLWKYCAEVETCHVGKLSFKVSPLKAIGWDGMYQFLTETFGTSCLTYCWW